MKAFFCVLLSLSCISFAEKTKTTVPRPHLFTDNDSEQLYKIVADDGQAFFLSEETFEGKKVSYLGYGRGQNTLRILPLLTKRSDGWKKKVVKMFDRFPASTKCPHPTSFISQKKGAAEKQKDFCNEVLTKSEQTELQGLLREWKSFLYD